MLGLELKALSAEEDLREAKSDLTAYSAKIENLRAQGLSNAQLILALADDPKVPESERVKLSAFAKIIQIASKNKYDAALIEARINQIDLSTGMPDPIGFAQAVVFASSQNNQNGKVSAITQITIAKELGIELPDLDVATGSDMNDVFSKGIGVKRIKDPQTGEIREEAIFLQPGEFKTIRRGQAIGRTKNGDRALRIDNRVGRFITPLPENASAEDMAIYGLCGQFMSAFHNVNMCEIFFSGRSVFERGGGTLDIHMPEDFNRAQKLCQIFFGGTAGFDGALLGQSDLDRVPYLMQFHSRNGGAVIGDLNPEQMIDDYRQQGLIDKSGHLNWAKFEGMVTANRLALFGSEENFAQPA